MEREYLYANPYPHVNKKERDRLIRGTFEDDMTIRLVDEPAPERPEVDPEEAPYCYVYKANPDYGWFTQFESVTEKEPERWFWVERLLPKNEFSPHLTSMPATVSSGFTPQPFVAPDLPYFVNRTRSGLYPVYKKVYQSEARGVQTEITKIDGDVWKFQEDLQKFIKSKRPDFDYEVGVHEQHGKILIRFDCVFEVVEFLRSKGF